MEIPVASGIEHNLFEPEDTSLPECVVLEFSGQEGISQLTHFGVRLLSSDLDMDFSKILNKRASLNIWCWQDDACSVSIMESSPASGGPTGTRNTLGFRPNWSHSCGVCPESPVPHLPGRIYCGDHSGRAQGRRISVR